MIARNRIKSHLKKRPTVTKASGVIDRPDGDIHVEAEIRNNKPYLIMWSDNPEVVLGESDMQRGVDVLIRSTVP